MKIRQNTAVTSVTIMMFFLLVSFAGQAHAQSMATTENIDFRRNAYLGLGTGINSYTGLFGLRLEVPITDRFHIFGSAGLGSWGYKVGAGISYNLRKSLYGPALSIGYSSATGLADFETSLETTTDKMEIVTLDLKKVGNMLIMYSYQWKVGKANKISLGAGYAASLTTDTYEVTSNHTLSSTSRQMMQIMAPGGLVVSFAFVFGL
jgi:hypothetical protein